jgi:peptidyl-tRNA hydrolase
MNPGKMAAHSGHAAAAFMYKYVIDPLRKKKGEVAPYVEDWMKATSQGFGTQINLQVTDWNDALDIIEAAQAKGFCASKVYDPEYPYIVDGEVVEFISKIIHTTDPVCLNPKAPQVEQKWLCTRNEVTAIYVFGLKSELQNIMCSSKSLPLSLHP